MRKEWMMEPATYESAAKYLETSVEASTNEEYKELELQEELIKESQEHSPGSLIIVEGTMDKYKYASVLADHIHPCMFIVFPQDDGIYQQGNATCLTADSVRAWLEEHQDKFTVLLSPANSPDLSPIKNLWDHLYWVVRGMNPHLRNLAQLATALESAWFSIPMNTFRNLIDSSCTSHSSPLYERWLIWLLAGVYINATGLYVAK
ncbi:transposable element Tcb1 transposase [Trichonephila clavipes]|nr:transposable element Tcb1 transposase [Trichonephila clavipes]